YEVRLASGKGYGCFAIKPIKRGTRIIAESPLIFCPVAFYYENDIKEPFSKLSPEQQALYFTLHSAHNQDPSKYPKHIHPSVDESERCRIEEQRKARMAKEASVVSIFQTNCMQMEGGAAVFPYCARFNHSCNANATFSWNPAIWKQTVHAMRDIEEGEEITISYCDITLDRASRRWELMHYGFECECPACDDDEDPESFAAQTGPRRFRLMEIEEELKFMRGPMIAYGAKQEGFVGKLLEYTKLLIDEGDYTVRLANAYLDIAMTCEEHGDLRSAKLAALKALQIKLDSQGPDVPDVSQYQSVVGRINKKIAESGAEDIKYVKTQ
ncbi:SET domain-containing protein, partial [Sporormia fimetaria CBS 119925]